MAHYWRAGVKNTITNKVVLVYFSTEKDYDAEEITDFLEEEFNFSCVNCYLRHLSIIEYICNILTCHISTSRTCFNYNRSTLIG